MSDFIPDEFVYIDTETTGLDPKEAEIIEVCAVKFNRFGENLGTYHSYCYPVMGQIPERITAINGITNDMVKGKPPYIEIREDLMKFIGGRTLIGHNLIDFDIKFLKFKPKKMEDTLLMCRDKWGTGGNKLGQACKRLNIKFDPKSAHSATYDVEKGMELYLTMVAMENQSQQTMEIPEKKPELRATQVYSYSRLNTFITCPFKWYNQYILKKKEPEQPYHVVGKVMHKICEMSAYWCYSLTFGNKFESSKLLPVPAELMDDVVAECGKKTIYLPENPDDLMPHHIGVFIYGHKADCQRYYGYGFSELLNKIESMTSQDKYETVDKPDQETYAKIVQVAIATERCNDPDQLKDIEWMSRSLYNQKDYTNYDNSVALVELKLIFDNKWNAMSNFFAEDGYFRAVMDVVEYQDKCVTITDYKTSRVMMTADQLRNDNQLKSYARCMFKYLPEGSFNKLVIRHHYIRYNKIVVVEFDNPEQVAKEADIWISETVKQIETELLDPANSFKPNRNKFCGSCYLAESNECPLFSVKHINDIKDPANFEVNTMQSLAQAWKAIEVKEMEIANLTKKCKAFVKRATGRVSIDGKAQLDFWAQKTVSIDSVKAAKLLIDKGLKIADVLYACNLTETKLEGLLEKKGIELTKKEKDSIAEEGVKNTFDAYTPEQAKEKECLNVM